MVMVMMLEKNRGNEEKLAVIELIHQEHNGNGSQNVSEMLRRRTVNYEAGLSLLSVIVVLYIRPSIIFIHALCTTVQTA